MQTIAIIPARGGSKRIPKKNIKAFCGKPLIAYSIEAAKASGLFSKIVVSTDCPKITDIARQYGAEVPFIRPPELSDDFTGTTPVVRHAIDYLRNQGIQPEYVCCIYSTAPLLQAIYLQQGLHQLQQNLDKCFAFSVTSFAFPIQRAIRVLADGGVEAINSKLIGQRSQDLEEAYHDAGQFYWGRTSAWLEGQRMFAPHSLPIVLPRHLVQDIDTPEDWQRAELLFKAYVTTEAQRTQN
ncbi:pseudaminic acid cytidylyltransferase [Bowmanella denitrificans]|uniref:pseudaminic acid cytidylyltransferase n=1 Tax=Bowmanella denitrificans TaxID=366582 RepID=UPI000C9B411D|nr:pseudaminic acid cytidylyltransferase [Bowmanella denitrificans]